MEHKVYRYRDNAYTPKESVQAAAKHLWKIGEIRSIKGYSYLGRFEEPHQAVMFRGEGGTARFNGFNWGQICRGSIGLVSALCLVGIHKEFAEHIAFNSVNWFNFAHNNEATVNYWVLTFDKLGRRKFQTKELIAA